VIIDREFLSLLHFLITDKEHQYTDWAVMLLSNLAKSDKINILFGIQAPPVEGLAETTLLGQLLEVFSIGEGKKWNTHANFNFLANFFGDLSRVLSFLWH
jgi:Domain of unknown function (DUF383)